MESVFDELHSILESLIRCAVMKPTHFWLSARRSWSSCVCLQTAAPCPERRQDEQAFQLKGRQHDGPPSQPRPLLRRFGSSHVSMFIYGLHAPPDPDHGWTGLILPGLKRSWIRLRPAASPLYPLTQTHAAEADPPLSFTRPVVGGVGGAKAAGPGGRSVLFVVH